MKQIQYIFYTLVALFLFACQADDSSVGNKGYLSLSVGQDYTVQTKADKYNPDRLAVKIINASDQVVKETTDFDGEWKGEKIELTPGTYTIEACSYNYVDNSSYGENGAYYWGSTEVTIEKDKEASATVKCSLANVKVTVGFDTKLVEQSGGRIMAQIQNAEGTYTAREFSPESLNTIAFFPATDLNVKITLTDEDGVTTNSMTQEIKEVKARDHYIINIKLQETGNENITVRVDPTMNVYTYEFNVSRHPSNQATLSVNPWSRFAYLEAKSVSASSGVDLSALKFQYREKGQENWMDVAASLAEEVYSAKVTGLIANTTYEYQLTNGNEYSVNGGEFTTEIETALPNGNLDEWWRAEDKDSSPWYAIASGDATSFDTANKTLYSFWDSGNGGTAILSKNPTQPETEEVHTSGGKSAYLASQYVGVKVLKMGKFAAGNLYTGHFCSANMSTYQAKIYFGQPFTSRPTQLKGWFKYKRGTTVDFPEDGGEYKTILNNAGGDLCSVYIALTDNVGFTQDGRNFAYEVNGDLDSDSPSQFKYKNAIDFSTNNADVIAYGTITDEEAKGTGDWQEFTIDLKYRDLTRTPKYIIVVASASKYGDYFTGSTSSVMYVDDLSLVYGDNPSVQE